MKRFLKKAMLAGLSAFPVNGIPVLTYHSVDDTGSVISISPSLFEEQMEFLAGQGYKTISPDTYCSRLLNPSAVPAREAVITFDDGFRNNYTTAFPVLKRCGFTAVIFLTSGFMGRTSGWPGDKSIPAMPLLSWDEAREMAAAGIEFGSHTITHADLTAAPNPDFEISDSKKIIEENLDTPINYFCYPYGKYNAKICQMVKKAGFKAAFTTEFGNNHPEMIYSLKRTGTSYFHDINEFRAGISGAFGRYLKIKRFLIK